MVIVIKRNSSKKVIQDALNKIHVRKGFDAYKYLGILKLKGDPIGIQKKVRDEWE